MSDAPYDVVQHFQVDGDDLELHEIFVQGAEPDPGAWIPISEGHRQLDSTVLVRLYRAGTRRIAVKHEQRVVEFDLYSVIVRGTPVVGLEREERS